MLKNFWARLRAAVDGRLRVLLPIVLALAATVTIVVTVDVGPDGRHPHVTVTVHTANGQPVQVTAPTAAVDQAAAGLDDHVDAKDETPEGVPAAVIEAGRDQQERLAATDQLPIVSPLAAPSQPGCRSQFVGNHSSRRGVRPRVIVLHYTVSRNIPGWGDVDALTAYSASPASGVSWHYNIDQEGHCAYTVKESDKAWTQAGFNSLAIGIEVVNTGKDPSYAGTAGLAKLARVISDSAGRWEIPLQAGAVSGCTVTRAGIVDHNTLGACGGGHVDITPYRTSTVIAAAVAYRQAHTTAITAARAQAAVNRRTCRRLNAWRAAGRPGGHQVVVNVRRRRALAARGLVCTSHGPQKSDAAR